MKSIPGKRLCKLAELRGWNLRKIEGSHHIYTQEGRRERLSIPVHGNKDLKIGLLHAMMKIIGLKEEDL